MSYHVFFSFSTGLAKTFHVPKGTKESWVKHVVEVETTLGLTRTQYEDNPVRWDSFERNFEKVDDELLCETVKEHNAWVEECYKHLDFWSENPFTVGKGHQDVSPNTAYPIGWTHEEITPEDAKAFWHGFEMLNIPIKRWSQDYYVARMEHLYEVMRGRTSEGVSFDVKALTPKQADQVVNIFSTYLDAHDMRLDVPVGYDYLASSYDGGYDWCEKCGPMHPDHNCTKRKCPIREEREL